MPMLTRATLADELRRLGVPERGLLLVHSSFRALGPVDGGPEAVVGALLDAMGPAGTVMAPTFTTNLIDPYTWPVPPEERERARILADIPYFDPTTSRPHKMGIIAEALWRTPGTLRSAHPVTSWAARGTLAEALLKDQPLDDPEGRDGPVGRAWQRDAWVLLLGVEHDADTTVHLAESLLEMPHLEILPDRYPSRDARGARVWLPVRKTTKCSDGFLGLGPHLDTAGVVRRGPTGACQSQLVRSRDVVRVAANLLRRQPTALLCADPDCVHCPASRRVLAAWRAPTGTPEAPPA
ncbi:MAG: AAC(3) family N-acetyltransferase [Deltaproteobacteria bacterium]|nr:AAC(3) family N-acetyltransferase [Deltaproteobacteria bacterium]